MHTTMKQLGFIDCSCLWYDGDCPDIAFKIQWNRR